MIVNDKTTEWFDWILSSLLKAVDCYFRCINMSTVKTLEIHQDTLIIYTVCIFHIYCMFLIFYLNKFRDYRFSIWAIMKLEQEQLFKSRVLFIIFFYWWQKNSIFNRKSLYTVWSRILAHILKWKKWDIFQRSHLIL